MKKSEVTRSLGSRIVRAGLWAVAAFVVIKAILGLLAVIASFAMFVLGVVLIVGVISYLTRL